MSRPRGGVLGFIGFAFANALLEPFWNRSHVKERKTTMAFDYGSRFQPTERREPGVVCRTMVSSGSRPSRLAYERVGELIIVWQDPDFDPPRRAFYCARVIEIPTPRWAAYNAKYFQVQVLQDVPMTTQERAYTSPIWYTPGTCTHTDSQRTSG